MRLFSNRSEKAGALSKGVEVDIAIEVRFEEGEKTFREWTIRVIVGEFEDVVEEFVGEGGEVIDSRRRLRRRRRSAQTEFGETGKAYSAES